MNPDTSIGNAGDLRYLLDTAPKAHPYTTILQTLPNNSDFSFMENPQWMFLAGGYRGG